MFAVAPNRGTMGPSPQLAKTFPIPAPQLGINAVAGLAAMDPQEAIFMFNLFPSQYGVRVRTGYEVWAEAVDAEVRTIIPFRGLATSKLFAAGPLGIYDVTVGGAGPWVPTPAFPVTTGDAGYGQWVNFTTIAGGHVIYTDEENGYFLYPDGGPWTQVTGAQVTNVNPNNLVAVTVYKEKLWFVERDTCNAWYLPTGLVTGAATKFDLGNKFKHGGTLKAIYSWTVDGGEGVDDHLVFISSEGDVILYKGDDPASPATWRLRGQWYIGAVPAGRRIGGHLGGELYLLSQYGIIPTSRLISGTLVQMEASYLSRKITPLISEMMALTRENLGWELAFVPHEQQLIVGVPRRPSFPPIEFVQSTNNEAWTIFRDIPYFTGGMWEGAFYIGSYDGNVYLYTGTQDAVPLDDDAGQSIVWSYLQTFQDFGGPGMYHIGQFVRPVFIAGQEPAYVVEARYDYFMDEAAGTPTPVTSFGSLWDVGVWDLALWGGIFNTFDRLFGIGGIGRATAVAIQGSSSAVTTLVRMDVTMTQGWSI